MATKVPISVENIAFERLNLSRHYLTIDCDFTCFLVLNPSGQIPSEGTDIAVFHVGAWQVNAWNFLTKKDFPNQAGFSACLVWDKTLVTDNARAPSAVESDIDTANSVSNLRGQPVNIVGFSMQSGESLPTSLVMGAGDEAISDVNPLPVRVGFQSRFFESSPGSPSYQNILRGFGFKKTFEGPDIIKFSGVPKTLFGRYTDGDGGIIAVDRGFLMVFGDTANNCRLWRIWGAYVAIRFSPESGSFTTASDYGTISSISFTGSFTGVNGGDIPGHFSHPMSSIQMSI